MDFESEPKDQPMQDAGMYEKYVAKIKELAKKQDVEKLMPKDIKDAHARLRPGGGQTPTPEWQQGVDELRDRLLIESKQRRAALKGKSQAPPAQKKRKIATHSPPKQQSAAAKKPPVPAARKQAAAPVSEVQRLQKENHKLRQICIALLMEEN